MTNNDFTRAARAEAEGKFPPPRESAVIYPLSAVRSHSRGAFLAGAEWARDYLTEQEPIDAEAIAYLAAFVEDLPPGAGDDWTPDTIARVKRGLRAARRDEEKQDG